MQGLYRFGKALVKRSTLIAATIAFTVCGAVPSFASDASYSLGSGDTIRITVFGEDDLSGQYEIDGSGIVAFPLIGEVQAAGGTARDLEQAITSKLTDGYLTNPTVNVEILTYRPFFILGEVKRPGSYAYKNGLNVLNAVAMAGGYTYRAKSSVWVITRSGDKTYQETEVNDGDFRVQPGDTIFIPERFF